MQTAQNPSSSPRTVVLGGTGFLGYHAVIELLGRGHRVTVLALDLPAQDPTRIPVAHVTHRSSCNTNNAAPGHSFSMSYGSW